MSHSTQLGFNCPPASMTPIAGSVNCPRRCPGLLLPFQSFALGVGILIKPFSEAVGAAIFSEQIVVKSIVAELARSTI